MVIAIAVLGLVVAVMALPVNIPWLAFIAFTLWGVAFGAMPPLLNTIVLHSASHRIRDFASALYTTSFNVGIGGGALPDAALYGVVGLEALPWVFVAVLVIAGGVLVLADRRRKAS